jgi:hypothetical protein
MMNLADDRPAVVNQRRRNLPTDALAGSRDDRGSLDCHLKNSCLEPRREAIQWRANAREPRAN